MPLADSLFYRQWILPSRDSLWLVNGYCHQPIAYLMVTGYCHQLNTCHTVTGYCHQLIACFTVIEYINMFANQHVQGFASSKIGSLFYRHWIPPSTDSLWLVIGWILPSADCLFYRHWIPPSTDSMWLVIGYCHQLIAGLPVTGYCHQRIACDLSLDTAISWLLVFRLLDTAING